MTMITLYHDKPKKGSESYNRHQHFLKSYGNLKILPQSRERMPRKYTHYKNNKENSEADL